MVICGFESFRDVEKFPEEAVGKQDHEMPRKQRGEAFPWAASFLNNGERLYF
jgi:hypothetical protein